MRTLNRLLLAALLGLGATTVMAADDAPTPEPDVTIRQEGDRTVQEYRVNGFLYAIKVIPKHGKPVLPGAPGRQRRQLHPLGPARQADSAVADLQLVNPHLHDAPED
jgi:Protein of unknown function (DUF2782).